jgi:hypothetical protein
MVQKGIKSLSNMAAARVKGKTVKEGYELETNHSNCFNHVAGHLHTNMACQLFSQCLLVNTEVD